MTRRPVLINSLIAFVLSLSGVLAINTGLFRGPVVEETCEIPDNVALDPYSDGIADALLNLRSLPPLPPERIDTETLWLARAIYSETKRPEEQVLIAWVIRNRVETGYRGKTSYESVVLDPFQFSAFRPTSTKREHYSGLDSSSTEPGWRTALSIAFAVRHMDELYRPFAIDTRHFYSEQSMVDRNHPGWAADRQPVDIEFDHLEIDDRRFRFFRGVS